MIETSQRTSTPTSLYDIVNLTYNNPNNMIDYFKKLKIAVFYQERINNGKSNEEAAKAVNTSFATIKRY